MQENYDLLIERISSSSGIDKAEIEKKIEARRAKLSGLISKEGAAQIIAAELGVKFDNVQLKISELMGGMKKVGLVGKVISVFPAREFDKNGRKGKVLNFIVADQTANTRVVLWDTKHINMFESGELKQGDVVEIRNASSREGEIHLSGFSDLLKSSIVMDSVKTERSFIEKKIESVHDGNSVLIRGVVVQMFSPRFFYVCPECGKKVVASADSFSCNEHGVVSPKERVLLNLVIDDGTESLRVVLFSDQVEKLFSMEKLKDASALVEIKKELLGREIYLKGTVRKNQLFNNLEMTGQELVYVNPEELISVLQK